MTALAILLVVLGGAGVLAIILTAWTRRDKRTRSTTYSPTYRPTSYTPTSYTPTPTRTDDPSGFVTGLIVGQALSHHHTAPEPEPEPERAAPLQPGGGTFGGGGASGGWESTDETTDSGASDA